MRLLIPLVLFLVFSGCTTNADGSQTFVGILREDSQSYAARMQGNLLAEQRRAVELDNKIREEQLKQLQIQNEQLAAQKKSKP